MKLPIRVSEDSKEPIYHQIEHQLKQLIVGGHLPPGSLLPSIRTLSVDLNCSVITTRRAYHNLESEGYIQTIQGKGTFVASVEKEVEEHTKHKLLHASLIKIFEQSEQLGVTLHELQRLFENELEERRRGKP